MRDMAIRKYKTVCEKLSPAFQANWMSYQRTCEEAFAKGFKEGRYGPGSNPGAWHMSGDDLLYRDAYMARLLENLALGFCKDVQECLREMRERGVCRGARQKAEEEAGA